MKKILFNPFEKYTEMQLLLFGTLSIVIGAVVCAIFNMRFIGVLKLNPVESVKPFQPLFEIISCISCLTLFLWLAGKFINNKTRLIDILTASLLAFSPLYLLAVCNANQFLFKSTEKMKGLALAKNFSSIATLDLIYFCIFAILSILILIWFVVLLYNGFKTASNAKSTNHKIFFATALIIADVASRILIHNLNL